MDNATLVKWIRNVGVSLIVGVIVFIAAWQLAPCSQAPLQHDEDTHFHDNTDPPVIGGARDAAH